MDANTDRMTDPKHSTTQDTEEIQSDLSPYLSAKASRNDGTPLTSEEIAAAEEEALAWARLASRC